MAKMDKKQMRKEALKRRTQTAVSNRDKKGLGRASVVDLSKIDIPQYEIKSGRDKNIIDILPFEITQKWYENLRTFSGNATGLGVGMIDYKLEVPVHSNVGPDNKKCICLRLAFGKKCPMCEDTFLEYEKSKKDQDKDKLQALKVSWRTFYNIYDYEEEDENNAMKIWSNFSYHLFEKYLLKDVSEEEARIGETITFSDCEDGKILSFNGKEKEIGEGKNKTTFVEAETIEFENRDESFDEDETLEETISLDSLLTIPTYDQVQEMYLGMDDDEGTDELDPEPEKEEKKPARKKKTAGKKAKKEEPVKEEPEVEEEDDPPFDTDGDCPFGFVYGKDCNEHDKCQDDDGCPQATFEACAEEQERLAEEPDAPETDEDPKPEVEEEPEEEPEPPKKSRRGRSAKKGTSKTAEKEEKKETKPTSSRRRRRG